ncbi:hypothetical protein [Dactylosporangium sp. NPDC051484]|uniref:hypothetical protein n=1 Tax=Dactylosporangium sp. NPDC051484 TaxID=3154942 RepID=UPI00344C9C06
MWMANVVRSGQFTVEEALTLGLAHEIDSPDPGNPYQGFQSRVDMYNDWVGAKLGERALKNHIDAEVYLCLNMRGR